MKIINKNKLFYFFFESVFLFKSFDDALDVVFLVAVTEDSLLGNGFCHFNGFLFQNGHGGRTTRLLNTMPAARISNVWPKSCTWNPQTNPIIYLNFVFN